jgi:MFS family permease
MPESRYEVLGLFTAAMTGSSLVLMGTGALMPFFQTALHLNQTQLGLLLSVQLIGSVAMTAVSGMLTDRFGDKAVVLWSGFFMGLALLAASMVQSFSWLVGFLLIYGLGYAAVTPAGSHAIIYFFKKEDRGLAMGLRQCGIPIAGVLASILLPAIALRFDYQWALATAGVLTIAACTICSVLYREPEQLEGECASLRSMLLELMQMARDPRLILLTLASMTLVCSQFAVVAFLTLVLVHEAGLPVSIAVGIFTLSQITAIGGRLSWGWVSDRFFRGSRALPLALLCVLIAIVAMGLGTIRPGMPVWELAAIAAVAGFTAEGFFGLSVIGLAEVGGEEHSGSAIGVGLTWVFVAGGATPTFFGALAQVHGFAFAWHSLALLVLCGAVPALLASTAIARAAKTSTAG